MIGEIFEYKKGTKTKKYILVKSENGTCKGCVFINSSHCEKANANCSKLNSNINEDTIVKEYKD